MNAKAIAQPQLVFDQEHYLRLIESRGNLIRRVVPELRAALGLETALDAGCGIGFFAKILQDGGLSVRAFDGRSENVTEARERYPEIPFEKGDVQSPDILQLGSFDLVLCFGLLYHLESPLLAIRHLRALTTKALLLESMCLPGDQPWMLLRDEASLEDQSMTDVAFYPSEVCLVKMLYGAGFSSVYRVAELPDHDDFRDTAEHARRRTVLLATRSAIVISGFDLTLEPRYTTDPWQGSRPQIAGLGSRIGGFIRKPAGQKYSALAQRFRKVFPTVPIPLRLPFGAWFLAGGGMIDHGLLCGAFENAEVQFVNKFLRAGMTALDIGAHHGLYTLLASKRVGRQGRVIAFEPSPREREKLSRHVNMNFCRNVRIEATALGSEEFQADLFLVDGQEDGCNSLRPPAHGLPTRKVSVRVEPLDAYLEKTGIASVDFVKLDVEGAEREVLRGATRLLSRQPRPVILAEVQDVRTEPWGYAARELVQFLDRFNFDWFELLTDGRLRRIGEDRKAFDANLVAVPRERLGEVLSD